MFRVLKTLLTLLVPIGSLLGILYIPADIAGLPEAYPFVRRILNLERETKLIWFSGFLVAYLVFVELRPYWRAWKMGRSWVSYAEAAQIIYEDFRDNDMVAGLIRDSNHPRPVEAVMGSWIEHGLNEGIIHGLGRLEHSREVEDVPSNVSIETGVMFERPDGSFSDEIAARERNTGHYWRSLQFKIKDIRKYLRQLEAGTIEFERRKASEK